MLTFRQEDNLPVALINSKGANYEILNPLNLTRKAVAQIRDRLSSSVLRTIFASLFSLLSLVLLLIYSFPLALVAIVIAFVRVTVERRSPFSFVLPILREWSSVEY